jgi:hypothetical protein
MNKPKSPLPDLGEEMHKLFIGHKMSEILALTMAAACTAAHEMGLTKAQAVGIFAEGFDAK